MWTEVSMDLIKFVNEDEALNYMFRNSCDFRYSRFDGSATNIRPVGEVWNVSINVLLKREVA